MFGIKELNTECKVYKKFVHLWMGILRCWNRQFCFFLLLVLSDLKVLRHEEIIKQLMQLNINWLFADQQWVHGMIVYISCKRIGDA